MLFFRHFPESLDLEIDSQCGADVGEEDAFGDPVDEAGLADGCVAGKDDFVGLVRRSGRRDLVGRQHLSQGSAPRRGVGGGRPRCADWFGPRRGNGGNGGRRENPIGLIRLLGEHRIDFLCVVLNNNLKGKFDVTLY